jgi:uncharacterized membrane protein
MGENGMAADTVALYGVVLLMAGVAYYILARALARLHGPASALALAIGKDRKGLISLVIYALAIPLAFLSAWLAFGMYVAVALIWFIPDRRIERALTS